MTSTKPYLIRAFNEWILDNHYTPYLLVDAEQPGVHVPREYVKNGQIIFDMTPGAVAKLIIGNEVIEFDARFSGILKHIYIPVSAVMAIYAQENGQGMFFEPDPEFEAETEEDSAGMDEASAKKTGNTPPSDKPPKRGKPQLKVIK